MRTRSQRANDWRLFGGAGFLTVFSLVVILTGCYAQFKHDPRYDGESELPQTFEDSTLLIPLVIENNRGRDGSAPRFYLESFGRHDLGIVQGNTTTPIKWIDASWLRSDGCFRIGAHWVGTADDWRSLEICWRRGENIRVVLHTILTNSYASSLR